MEDPRGQEPAERLRAALDLIDFSLRVFRQRLRRENPELSEDQIDAKVEAWLGERPGAEQGDGEGEVGVWPRR